MKQFLLTFFGSIVGVLVGAILAVVLVVFVIGAFISDAMREAESASGPALPDAPLVLEIDLRDGRLDQPGRSPFAFAGPLSVVETVAALQRAESDERVAGVFVRANEFGMPPAQAEELARAFDAFSASGKFVIAHAQGFEGTSVLNYVAVAGVDELWLQATSSFSAVGLTAETLFLGGAFEQFGAEPQFIQRYEYKNAADVYTESDYTDAHREATLAWLGSVFEEGLAFAAAHRGIDAGELRNAVESGPHTAETALRLGLVDALGHVHAAEAAAMERAGEDARMISINAYSRSPDPQRGRGGPVIALVEGQGAIVTGDGDSGFGGEELIGGDRLAEAIDAAAGDDDVRAILLRVDSPGGSAIASDQVWDAIVRAREAGKPVVVSMGTLAASGGYYVAAPADVIVANATTLTGSIGVLGGKLVLDGALDRLGLNIAPLAVGGEYALAFSAATPWSEAQRAGFEAMIDEIYADFTGKVAEGRGLPLEEVEAVARGRVWTGAQALERGLVDRIGGFREAVDAAAEIAGVEEGEQPVLRRFPRRPTPFEAFSEIFGVTADTAETAAALNALMELPEVQAALRARREAEMGGARLYAPHAEPR